MYWKPEVSQIIYNSGENAGEYGPATDKGRNSAQTNKDVWCTRVVDIRDIREKILDNLEKMEYFFYVSIRILKQVLKDFLINTKHSIYSRQQIKISTTAQP